MGGRKKNKGKTGEQQTNHRFGNQTTGTPPIVKYQKKNPSPS